MNIALKLQQYQLSNSNFQTLIELAQLLEENFTILINNKNRYISLIITYITLKSYRDNSFNFK